MSDLIPEGNYKARAVASYCDTSNTKGTPFVNITFRILEGDLADVEIDTQLYVTPKTQENFVKDLRTLGYRGHNPDELNRLDETAVADFLPNDVSIKVQHEEFNNQIRARVRYINPLAKRAAGSGGVFADMKAAFLAHPAEPAPPRGGPMERKPRQPQPEPEEDAVPFLSLPAFGRVPLCSRPTRSLSALSASCSALVGAARGTRERAGGREQSRALPTATLCRSPAMPKKKPAPVPFVPTPRCDVCGTDAAPLTREPVEGVVCERCPDCKRQGLVP